MLQGRNVKGIMITLEELEKYFKDIIIHKKINDDFDKKVYDNFWNELFYASRSRNRKEIENKKITNLNLFIEENSILLNIEYNGLDDIDETDEEIPILTEDEIPIEYLLGEIVPYQRGYRIENVLIIEATNS